MGSNGYSIEFGDKLIDDCDEGIVKEGNRYKIKVFYDDGVVRDKLCSVRNINKCVVEVDGESEEETSHPCNEDGVENCED